MKIPKCEDDEGTVQEEHCWHPSSMAAQAPMSQRCCYCGLDFRIHQTSFVVDKKHGKHGDHQINQNYQLAFDTTYQDMYKADPETFKGLFKAMEEGRRAMEDFHRDFYNPRMSGF